MTRRGRVTLFADGSHLGGIATQPVATFEPSDVPCPLCAGPMRRVLASFYGRVVKVVGPPEPDGRAPVLVAEIPPDTIVLACAACRVTFASLAEAA